ncbi:MAG: hypothetical protein ACP5NQ_03185 [Vulcanisaeta sp.]
MDDSQPSLSPWFHLGKATELLVAAAHYQFAKGLVKEFKRKEFNKYMIKYFLSVLINVKDAFRGLMKVLILFRDSLDRFGGSERVLAPLLGF